MNWKEFFSEYGIPLSVVALMSLVALGAGIFSPRNSFDKQPADIIEAIQTPVSSATSEPLCDNYAEIEDFEKPIPVVWTASMDGCLVSCEGAAFTRVPEDKKYPRFAGYFPDSLGEELLRAKAVLKISGAWIGIGADHPHTVFENKCVPIIQINKIEVI